MKSRYVGLLGVVIALALTSELVGFWLGRYQVTSAMAIVGVPIREPAGNLIQLEAPHSVLEGPVRLYADATLMSSVAYTIERDKVWIGADITRPPVYTIYPDRLVRSANNQIVYTFSGNRIYRGTEPHPDAVAYTIVEHRVYPDDRTTGTPLLSYIGHRVHWGAGPTDPIMITANTDIEGNSALELLLPILLLERFQHL